ncbi:MAG: alpha/beta fold hydrolase [Gammaproteobacteria bacterium]
MLSKLILIAGAAYVGYRMFPERIFDFAMRMSRRRAGLDLREITIDGHRVPYLEGGHGEPLLLLHGFGAEKDHWTQVSRYLTPHFRVIAPDLPGFGESTRRQDANYGLDSQLERLAQFVSALGLTRFHLGGNSMGGYLAAMYAARSPDQVQTLWLLAPAGVGSAEPGELLTMIGRGENLLLVESEEQGKRLAGMLFARMPYVPEEFNRIWRQRTMRDRDFNAKIFHEMFDSPVMLEDRINGLATPTYIVWGDDDRVLHRSGAALLQNMLANADVRIMPCMGHCPMIERPRDTAFDFLNYHRRAFT